LQWIFQVFCLSIKDEEEKVLSDRHPRCLVHIEEAKFKVSGHMIWENSTVVCDETILNYNAEVAEIQVGNRFFFCHKSKPTSSLESLSSPV